MIAGFDVSGAGMFCRAVLAAAIAISLVTDLGAGPQQASQRIGRMNALHIDHVILGVSDVHAGMREFADATGVKPVEGGAHPSWGTENALVSLGQGSYLEILAPQHGVHPQAPTLEPLTDLLQLTPVGWAIATPALDRSVQTLRAAGFTVSDPRRGSRLRPDGQRVTWRTAAVADRPIIIPFLIEWDRKTPHPSSDAPQGCTLTRLEIETPDADELIRMLGVLQVDAKVTYGGTNAMRVTLQCPKGTVQFGRAPQIQM